MLSYQEERVRDNLPEMLKRMSTSQTGPALPENQLLLEVANMYKVFDGLSGMNLLRGFNYHVNFNRMIII